MGPRRINPDTGVIEHHDDWFEEFFGIWSPVDEDEI
jgi:hypothetical protein